MTPYSRQDYVSCERYDYEDVGQQLTLKSDMAMTSSIPTSNISMTSPAKQRTQTRPWGRFFVCVPIRNRLASFFELQKLSDELSSNGRIKFDFEKVIACGFLSWFCLERACQLALRLRHAKQTRTSSVRAVLTLSEMPALLTKTAVFASFSTNLGSRATAARLLLAFLGFAGAMIGVDISSGSLVGE